MEKRSNSSDAEAVVIAPEAPYPPAGGGALRSASLVEYLGRRYRLDAIVFRQPGAPPPEHAIPGGLVRNVLTLNLPYHSKGFVARTVRNAGRLLRSAPPLVDRFAGFEEQVARFVRGRRYRLAVIEHFWCAPYQEQVAPHSDRVVLDLHNIESVLLAGCAGAESGPAAWALRQFCRACLKLERRWLPRFDLLLAASEADAERVRAIVPGCRVEVFPNALPAVRQPQRREEDAIVFSGNLGYLPNAMAVRFFRERVWPLLRRRWPGLVWRLVGRNAQAIERYVNGDPHIEIAGPPENGVEALASAKAAVVPVLAGSGTRVKILEAWAAGRAVVSTPLGAEGLHARHGEHLLLAGGEEEFAEAVSDVLESEDLRRRLGVAGRALFEAEFTWPAAWGRLALTGI